MRLRRWASAVAILGVLVHASLIVRHSTALIAAQLEHSDLVAALSVICHSDSSVRRLAADEMPDLPAPKPDRNACPICAGQVASGAVLPLVASLSPPLSRIAPASFASACTPSIDRHAVRPPSRGPPLPV